ncbi:MAG: signal recognition particle-docking protein FtsY [Alphaproteobacteria bacterium]|nr:signal recognition particle-docking protein FtsY [Alphaproteobacteria bacterium]MAS47577.1 signal recognition particle-docking protein FtsY [Alphaproteobacteria bacterium]MAX96551.1 signal recognition particle-docking protein FtsY [Alphaproteobacteria bacterium]MBN52116.1 signal recognition particle-docking protein FtsY [Alphaproteobacteria bacterium]OUT40938.1 MAG: signal recognition particle-docking protein FtsY [Micavibrio sp. TMED2]|tara:strand:+ start:5036 stop:5998 length:963 start_codon:yes stop_codon:yes gene_type:complete
MSEQTKQKTGGWLSRLAGGLSKSSDKIGGGIADIFSGRPLDDDALEELEELLITADLGPAPAAKIVAQLAGQKFGRNADPDEVKAALAKIIEPMLEPVVQPLEVKTAHRPHVVLVVGVNGSGKTTTIAKLANLLQDNRFTVTLAAGDTFRAAAIEQLKIWGERANCPVIARDHGADAAGVAFEAVESARADGRDVVLIDTAGRLQNQSNLMAELEKISRVLKKLDPDAPHSTVLVLDATVGQNAFSQVEAFQKIANVTGLVVTKLDGSARGGVVIGLAERFGLPVHAIGVGEGIDDLRPFTAASFARLLVGLPPDADQAT